MSRNRRRSRLRLCRQRKAQQRRQLKFTPHREEKAALRLAEWISSHIIIKVYIDASLLFCFEFGVGFFSVMVWQKTRVTVGICRRKGGVGVYRLGIQRITSYRTHWPLSSQGLSSAWSPWTVTLGTGAYRRKGCRSCTPTYEDDYFLAFAHLAIVHVFE